VSNTVSACNTNAAFNLFTSLSGTPDTGGTWLQTSGASRTITGDNVNLNGAAAGSYVFQYTVTGTSPCTNATSQVTVNVVAAPNAGANNSVSSCNNTSSFNLFTNLSGSPDPGGVWSQTSGVARAITGNNVNLNGASAGVYVFRYTVTATSPCSNATADVTVTVVEAPDAGISASVSACNDDSSFDLFGSLAGSPDNGGTWIQTSGSARTITGSDVNLNGATAGTYAFQYTVNGTSPCGNATATLTVTVNDLPSAGANNTIATCNNNASFNMLANLSGSPDAGGSWTQTSGAARTITGNNVNLLNATAGTYIFQYTVAGSAPCPNATATLTINVSDGPDAGISNSVSACTTETAFDLLAALDGTPDGGGTWTDMDGSGGPISGNNINLTSVAPGPYRFQYSLTGTAPCSNASAIVTVNVISGTPDAGSDNSQNVCNNQAAYNLLSNLSGSPDPGGVWTDVNSSGGLITGDNINLTNVGAGTFDFLYTITVAGCGSSSATLTLNVTESPDAGSDNTVSACNTSSSFNLFSSLSGTPQVGGSWTQTAGTTRTITGNNVNLNGAAAGSYAFQYTVTGTAPCANASATVTVNVVEAPNSGLDNTVSACNSDNAFNLLLNLAGTPDSGGTWSQTFGAARTITGNAVNFSGAASGQYIFEYTVTGTAPCVNQTSELIVNVNDAPDAGTSNSVSACNSNTAFNLFSSLVGTPDNGGAWTQLSGPSLTVTGNNVNLSPATAGNYVFQYTVTGMAPCANATSTVTVNVTDAPSSGTDNTVTACNADTAFDLFASLGGSPDSGGAWTDLDGGGVISGNTVNLTGATAGSDYRFLYTVTGSGPCVNATAIVTVSVINGAPDPGTPATVNACNNDSSFDLFGSLGGSPDPGGSWSDVNLSGAAISGNLLDVTSLSAGSYDFEYTIDLGSCGSASATVTVNVLNGPDAGSDNAVAVCNDEDALNLFSSLGGSPDGGGSWADTDLSGAARTGNVADFSAVSPGTYDFTYSVSASGGCPAATSVLTVTVNALPNPAFVVSNATCTGVNNGSITITSVAGYTYSISGGAPFTATNSFTNLTAGSYSVVVRDGNGCVSIPEPATINTSSFILPTIGKVDATCLGVNNGSITITAITGGSAAYEYSNDNGVSFQPGNQFTNLPGQSNHSIVVKDANGCLSSAFSIIINNSVAITTDIDVQDVSSCALNDGSITVTPIGGSAAYTFSNDNGVSFVSNGGVFSPLSAGDYEVVVKDNAGCLSSSETVSIEVIDNIIPVIEKTDASCNGVANGSIRITSVTGGSPAYQYSKDNGATYQALNEFLNLSAGDYSVKIKDAAGCVSSVHAVIVSNTSSITMQVVATDESCTGGDGKIEITNPSGGAAPYSYSKNNGVSFELTSTFELLVQGSYNVVIKDNAGCISAPILTAVSKPSNCNVNPDPGTGLCATVRITPESVAANCASADGKIIFHIDPDTPANNVTGVKISIAGPVSRVNFNDTIFNALQAGVYQYQIVYGDNTPGCVKEGSVVVNKSGTVGYAQASDVVPPVCFGDSTGSVVIDVLTPVDITGEPLQWSLTPNVASSWRGFTAGGMIVGIPEGLPPNYEQTISVRKNASDPCYAGVNVLIPPATNPINATFNTNEASCNANDGSITNILPSGGVPSGTAFSYSLDGIIFKAENEFKDLNPGMYQVIVKDQAGCMQEFDALVLAPNYIEFSKDSVIHADCTNDGLSGKLVFEFANPGTYRVGISTDALAEPDKYRTYTTSGIPLVFDSLARGNYFVFVESDGAECSIGQGPYEVEGIYAIDFDIVTLCDGTELSLSLMNIQGNPNLGLEIRVFRNFTNLLETSINLGNFPVTRSYRIDRDEHAFMRSPGEYRFQIVQAGPSSTCTSISSELKNYEVPQALHAKVAFVDKSYPEIPTGEMIVNEFAGGIEPYAIRIELDSAASLALPSYQTDFVEPGLSTEHRFEQAYENIPAGRYKVQIEDSLGCAIELIGRVPMDTDIFIPNVFTPNNDGSNDIFFIRNLPDDNAKLIVTNRWGKEVYNSKGYKNDWEGEGAADGIYYYQLQVSGGDPITGWVEIMRGQKP
jgi:gliding motility-associated-like protein